MSLATNTGPLEALRHSVTAAMLTPFDASGTPAVDAAGPYAASLVLDGVGALAVGAHTGRGLHLSDDARGAVVRAVREAVDVPVVAGVGLAGQGGDSPASVERALARAGEETAAAGADALLVYPVPRGAHPDVPGLHALVARASGLPVIAFVLYEGASGQCYSADLARRLVATEGVLGLKVAVLDDAVACQDILTGCRAERAEAILFTGEDRMFGPSLMWGADAALVGIAAALPRVTVDVVRAWTEERHSDFVRTSGVLDVLAALVFRAPVDFYVQRMAWLAGWEGRLPRRLCHDPGSAPSAERERRLFVAAAEAVLTRAVAVPPGP
ncbi:MAG: dihydrodipicolinate synthase family protein [Actinophytocola sp.]|uniref:dihydrodipicolinate synthase family protein n=1 Tax=Actinophytocola sp. TaxID=1872138 RepID=UPI0013254410|nr:dihydrodipicolinate synthase family protein [Actinophytocola sp.]MPZ82314.1 dihydrodipicolinate synthase family protein [Actinophytocola sp.]